MALETCKKVGNDLYHKLHLSTYPVAIKYIESTDEIPETAWWPSQMGKKNGVMSSLYHGPAYGYNSCHDRAG